MDKLQDFALYILCPTWVLLLLWLNLPQTAPSACLSTVSREMCETQVSTFNTAIKHDGTFKLTDDHKVIYLASLEKVVDKVSKPVMDYDNAAVIILTDTKNNVSSITNYELTQKTSLPDKNIYVGVVNNEHLTLYHDNNVISAGTLDDLSSNLHAKTETANQIETRVAIGVVIIAILVPVILIVDRLMVSN